MFSTLCGTYFSFQMHSKMSSAICFNLDQSKILSSGNGLTLSQTSAGFYVYITSLLKTLWEKEKLLVMSNFSFSYSVLYQFEELSAIFIKFEIVICKLFQFVQSRNLSFVKELTLYLLQKNVNFYKFKEFADDKLNTGIPAY